MACSTEPIKVGFSSTSDILWPRCTLRLISPYISILRNRKVAVVYEWPLLADFVEKVDFLELPKDWSEKPPFSTLLREISA
ncbi:hypothetical protein QN375_02960 [Pseudomonas sp. MH9.2]|uniref:hypothetical protein n=1 Tax=Pseudomonas sp. MH9.2 TaxID=3048629 RepID=UPI002AC923F8|nr:hypothetical protein [Pseudomonas sp. MH9.2]MEB0024757.1 hypothetical protein [Pseudomonas sp. MH9.2]WPX70687.1 hypothetical protein RHM55_09085 [Pseudomonas sp. MH9.2]